MFKKLTQLGLIVLLVVSLTGCDLSPAGDLPTPYPESYLPTVIALTAAAAFPTAPAGPEPGALNPGPDPGPTVIPARPTATPIPPLQTATPSATPTPLPPPGPIQITAPGPMSKIASPLRLRGYVVPGDKNLVNVELFGEDGRLVTQNLTRLYGSSARGAYLSLDLPFAIPFAAELARLQITTADQYGRPIGIVSVHVILLATGVSTINPEGPPERCVFFSPSKPNMPVRGGSLQVRGRYQPFSDETVFLELLDSTGKVLDSRPLPFLGLGMQNFASNLSYSVKESTAALIVLRQPDDRIPGPFYLYSREVTLLP